MTSITRQSVRYRYTAKHVRLSSALSSPFKPWQQHMLESDGDYRKEAFLEEHIGGPLYAKQAEMPKLPIPTLEETIDRFLPTALPFVKTEEEKAALLKACEEFPAQAVKLQERLFHKRDVEMADSNWIQVWWNQLCYLQVRCSVVINVSYYFQFANDPTASSQVERGAAMLFGAAEFRKQVCSGQFPAETIGKKKTTLCSAAFKYMFNACRIPVRVQDSYRIYDPSRYSHAVVARKGHFFTIPLCDPITADPLPVQDLQASLEKVRDLADQSPPALELGILSSNDRDKWADSRNALLEAGGVAMTEALEKLESGALMLCLDDESPVSRRQMAEILLHGGSNSTGNRWFDKSIQLICCENGKSGLLGEHSMMDGMPMVRLADHICSVSYDDAVARSGTPTGSTSVESIFGPLQTTLSLSNVPDLVAESTNDIMEWKGMHDIHVQSFQGYGSSFIKKAGFSPDAYVQMAMQLATYRLWGEQGGTYESTQVRSFLQGRTECTRAVSTESEAFVKSMGLTPTMWEKDQSVRDSKVELLRSAVGAHVKFIGNAAKGMGVDRHFFGLSMLLEDGETPPSLFSQPVFATSKTWRVSTSNLTHPKFDNWGYGEVVPNGVGLSYSVHPRHCMFSVTALKEHGWTERLAHHLEEALVEMRNLVEEAPKSKL